MLTILMIVAAALIIVTLALVFYLYKRHQFRSSLSIAVSRFEAEQKMKRELEREFDEYRERVSQESLIDALTGLPGRKLFEDRLTLAINQGIRYQLTFAVLSLDLDSFKVINDALGHDAGDALLKEVAERLKTGIRQVDSISRFAGDGYVFLLSQLSKAETAVYVAQRLLDSISQPFLVQGQQIYVTASIGIAVFPADGKSVRALLQCADNALHQAKSRGRNTYQFYHEDMQALSRRELILSSSLHGDAVYDQFLLYYQPQINLETKKIVCMEALLRWNHPDFGLISFDEFSRLMDNSGKSAAIGAWMLKRACDDFLMWKKNGIFFDRLSMRVSFKQLESSHFIHKVSTLLQEMAIDPACILFEITEASLQVKINVMERMLHMLKHVGVQIAINHFGAGHLSLQYLKRLPVDIMKIDSSLIQDITVNKESEAIVKMIVSLAKSLQVTLVAEGVESINQKQLLENLGCVVMQGGLFGQPSLPLEFNHLTAVDARHWTQHPD